MESWAFLPGVPRSLLMIFVTLVLFKNVNNDYQFDQIIKVIFSCYFIAAITMVYQLYFGPVSWFSPHVTRGGLSRYSTILGSLTIYGSIIGYSIIVLFSKRALLKKKLLLLTIIFSGGFISLSKSAVIMMILSVIVFILFEWKHMKLIYFIKRIVPYVFIAVTSFLFLLLNVQTLQDYFNTIVIQAFGSDLSFINSSSIIVDSPRVSVEALYSRLFSWTGSMIEQYGPIVYFVGVGLQGGAGVMGLSGFSSSHNAFGDLFFMGGLLYLFIFLMLYVFTQYTHFKNRDNYISRIFIMVNILFLANMFVAAGSVYQPSISILFWLSVVYANKVNNRLRVIQ